MEAPITDVRRFGAGDLQKADPPMRVYYIPIHASRSSDFNHGISVT